MMAGRSSPTPDRIRSCDALLPTSFHRYMRQIVALNDRSRLQSTTVEALRLATLPIEYGTRMSIGDESDPRAYMQLAGVLRKAIMAGTYPSGTATPSITTLSQEYGHARQTCSK